VQDPVDASILYAGTTEGLWATRDSGENWARISPREWIINGVAFVTGSDPALSAKRLILGTEGQGILSATIPEKHLQPQMRGFRIRGCGSGGRRARCDSSSGPHP